MITDKIKELLVGNPEASIKIYDPEWNTTNVVERCEPYIGDDGNVWLYKLTPLTEENTVDHEKLLRSKIVDRRDGLLSNTDWMFRSDMYPTDEMAEYCEKLRNITNQATFPYSVVWPVAPNKKVIKESDLTVEEKIVAKVQTRLDNFAKTKNYDGILSACTYATSTVPKFYAEGQHAVVCRDNTWASLYSIMEQVLSGTRPVPTGYEDIESDLPELVWPT